jgi:Protein of unknown function (DUF3187)
MHGTYRWTAAGSLPLSQDTRSTLPRIGTIPHWALRLRRVAQGCLLLCFTYALLTTALCANATPAQESPRELSSTAVVGGPFPVRSLSPIQLLYFQFTPERAIPLPRGMWNVRFDLVEANILARDQNGDDSLLFDFELTRGNLALQYGLIDHLAVGLEIPLLYTWQGFLDGPIKEFEDVTGFRRTIRFERPQYLFDYILTKDGRTALKGTSGAIGIGDIGLTAKALLRGEGQLAPAVAGRFALKLPTGDEDRALGSGEVDVALGVALEKTFGPVRLYFNTGLTIPTGNPFAGTGIDSVPMLSSFLTGEYRLTDRFSILVQLNGITPPVRNTGLDIDQSTFEILAGFNWTLPGLPVVWQAGFMEDLNNTNRTADFALFMSWSIFFGHRASTHR